MHPAKVSKWCNATSHGRLLICVTKATSLNMTSATTLGRFACGRMHDMLMMQAKLQWHTNLCQTMHHPHLLQFSGALPHSTLSPQLLHIHPTMLLHDKSEQIKHTLRGIDTCCILITHCVVDTCCILITDAVCVHIASMVPLDQHMG